MINELTKLLTELKLKKHQDTDSPFAQIHTNNDNFDEINDWSKTVKDAITGIEAYLEDFTPEKIAEMIKEQLVMSKRVYTIPTSLISGNSIDLEDGTLLTRSSANEYTFTFPDARNVFVKVQNATTFQEIQPQVTTTSGSVRLRFELAINSPINVVMF